MTRTRHRIISAATALPLALQPALAHALPGGGVVSAGDASISSVGNQTNIYQSTDRAVIDWESFNVGANESVNFQQPGAASITMNRINDNNASQILGNINANGQVWLVNPNGIVFGASAQVNVGALVATTANITDANFMNGDFRFDEAGNLGFRTYFQAQAARLAQFFKQLTISVN